MSREQQFIQFFSALTADNLEQIHTIFTQDAHFKDPFNDVNTIEDIITVFKHMFETTESPQFIVNESASNHNKLFLQWQFTFTKNATNWRIDGSSMITFNDDDKVIEHIDYWDPAEQIYSKIGLLKPVMNFLKGRLTAG